MAIEIERRWLLAKCPPASFFPKLFKIEKLKLRQYYSDSSHRVRMTAFEDGSFLFEQFKKEWLGEASSLEEVRELEAETFNELVATKAKTKIVKTRMKVSRADGTGVVYEFDHITRKKFSNVNFLEIEFASKREAEAFQLNPLFNEFVICEVTNLRQFSNYALSEAI